MARAVRFSVSVHELLDVLERRGLLGPREGGA